MSGGDLVSDDAMTIALRAKDQIDAHEKFCLAMTQAMKDDLRQVRDTLSAASKVGIGVLVAMLGWFAIQLYDRVAPATPAQVIHAEQHQP